MQELRCGVWWEERLFIVEEEDANTSVCPWFKRCIRRIFVTLYVSNQEWWRRGCVHGAVGERESLKAWKIRKTMNLIIHSQCWRSCVKEIWIVYVSRFYMVHTGEVIFFQRLYRIEFICNTNSIFSWWLILRVLTRIKKKKETYKISSWCTTEWSSVVTLPWCFSKTWVRDIKSAVCL